MYNLLKNKIMNKKRFLALSFAAIAIVSGYAGIKAFRSQANGENDLLAQNIEALSESESVGFNEQHTISIEVLDTINNIHEKTIETYCIGIGALNCD